jgi:electron transport complex protein RnfG
MAKLVSSFRNKVLSLGTICIVVGCILATVNYITHEAIAATKKAKIENALRAVLPDFDNSPLEETYWVSLSENDSLKVYPAMKNGQWVGAAVESNSMQGFSGEIKVMVGLDAQGTVINYSVLEHAETPGLGDKMEKFFRTEKNNQNVLGRNLSRGSLKVTKDKGEIDTMTGATITSRAFIDALNRAYSAISQNGWDATSGATDKKEGGEK